MIFFYLGDINCNFRAIQKFGQKICRRVMIKKKEILIENFYDRKVLYNQRSNLRILKKVFMLILSRICFSKVEKIS